jgi:hypothetical protein
MDQMGHTGPQLALRIYARAMRRDPGEIERLKALAGVSEWAPTGTSASIDASEHEAERPTIRSAKRPQAA